MENTEKELGITLGGFYTSIDSEVFEVIAIRVTGVGHTVYGNMMEAKSAYTTSYSLTRFKRHWSDIDKDKYHDWTQDVVDAGFKTNPEVSRIQRVCKVGYDTARVIRDVGYLSGLFSVE